MAHVTQDHSSDHRRPKVAAGTPARSWETRRWEDWCNMVLGLLLALSPWLLGFTAYDAAMLAHIGLGGLVVLVAVIEVWQSGAPDTAA